MNPLRELEQTVLAEGREWTRRELEKRLQEQALRIPALNPQSGEALRQSRWRDLQLATVAGTVHVRVLHGYSAALCRWVCPARELWGMEAYQRVSPELQVRLAYTATEVGSYERAARMAEIWGSPASDDGIHHQVQRLGAAAQGLTLPTPAALPREPPFSLVIMMDGWMARERGPDWASDPRRKDSQRVAWHEIKSAVIYRLQQRVATSGGRGLLLEKFIVATPPETGPVDFGAAVQAEAMRRGLARARVVYLVMDGAVWLWDLAEDRFAEALKTLDFHHAREHLQAVAEALHGASTEAARKWLDKLLHSLRHGQEVRVVRRLEKLLTDSAPRPPETQAVIQREVSYLQKHRDHLHYQTMEQAGAPLGSGAVESLGKQLQGRLRGCGQFWQRSGLTHLLRLNVLFKNGDAPCLWN
jgi:hypothetical protein